MFKSLHQKAYSTFTIAIFFCLVQTTTSQVLSLYSGDLSSNSPKFSRPTDFTGDNSYYHAIQVSISTTGSYSFTSNSTMDLYAYFYSDSFDETHSSSNLIISDDNTGTNKQFQINARLSAGRSYVLIVTTSAEAEAITGSFSISTDGPASVIFKPFLSDTTASFSTTSSVFTTSTSSPLIPSYYYSSLSQTSATFVRPRQTSGVFYYQAVQVTIYTGGKYTFRSNSSLDTYGYFYSGSFDPSNPSRNLIASDDDSGGNYQFLLNVTLSYGGTYILVVTTFSPNAMGSFAVTALGPTSVSFSPFTPTTPAPTTTTASPLVPSYYYGSLLSTSPRFVRSGQTSGVFYYQAVQVTIYTGGKYTFRSNSSLDTYGYFYSGSFDPSNPSRNLIASDDDSGGNRQFLLNVTLSYGGTYILVVTTYGPNAMGSFAVTALGPTSVSFSPFTPTTPAPTTTTASPLVPSYYYGSLLSTGQRFARPGQTSGFYYYQAVRVAVYSSGKYTFRSNSSLDTYGYFYAGLFDPSNPSRNLIASDDDSGGNYQFLFNVTLSYGGIYILVVTTYAPNATGSFAVTALGPSSVNFSPPPPTTTGSPITTPSPLVPSYYSSSLSPNSATYIRPGQSSRLFHYEAIRVVIFVSGNYILRSSSVLDTYGYLYADSFDQLNPSRNLIASDDDSGGSGQFLLNVTLTYGRIYILVVTTYAPNIVGSYGVAVLGPSSVYFSPYAPTTPALTTTTSSPVIPSSYSGSLSSNSGIFIRPGETSGSFYYEAIRVTIYTGGKYTFRSSSVLDTYGCFYSGSFDPSNPSQNLIASDDDSGGSGQFLLNVTLTYGVTYILVVTTFAPSITGSYSVTSLGPAIVSWTSITPTLSLGLSVIGILAVAIGCIVFVGIILSACAACRRNRQRTINRVAVDSMNLEKIQPVGTNGNQMPYVISVGNVYGSSDEKPRLSIN